MVFLALGIGWMLTGREARVFLTLFGAFVVFLLVLSLVCWLNVPAALRRRPKMPEEFRAIRLGTFTPSGLEMLNGFSLVEEGVFKDGRHRHLDMERVFPEGSWRCQVEEVAGKVVACSVNFRSVASPVLDTGEENGVGRFVATPGQS